MQLLCQILVNLYLILSIFDRRFLLSALTINIVIEQCRDFHDLSQTVYTLIHCRTWHSNTVSRTDEMSVRFVQYFSTEFLIVSGLQHFWAEGIMVGIPNVKYLHQVEYLEIFEAECVFQKPSISLIYTYYFTLNSLTVLFWSRKVKLLREGDFIKSILIVCFIGPKLNKF